MSEKEYGEMDEPLMPAGETIGESLARYEKEREANKILDKYFKNIKEQESKMAFLRKEIQKRKLMP